MNFLVLFLFADLLVACGTEPSGKRFMGLNGNVNTVKDVGYEVENELGKVTAGDKQYHGVLF